MTKKQKGIICILIATFGFSVIPILASLGFNQDVSASAMLFFRFFLAGLLFLAYCLITKKKLIYSRKEMCSILLLGVIYSFQCLAFFSAFRYISASIGEIVYHCYPLFILILAAVVLKESVTKHKVIGVILSIAGTGLILYTPWNDLEWKGLILVILTALISSVYMVLTKKFITNIDALPLTTLLSCICAMFFFLYSIGMGELKIVFSPTIIVYVLVLAFFSTVVGFFCFNKSIKLLDVGKVSILSLTEPIFTIILAAIVLKDHLSFLQLVGTGIVLIAIYIYEKST